MDILVNIQSLQPPITGIGRYTTELLNCLTDNHNIQAFDVTNNYSQNQLREKLGHVNEFTGADSSPNRLLSSLKRTVGRLPYSYQARQLIRQKINQKKFRQCKDYIYWEPNYILQPFDGASVATIHDLSYIRYPQHHTSASLRWLGNNIEASIEQASAILTLSEFSKNELIHYFSIPESNISIVPPAVVTDFKKNVTTENVDEVRRKYNLPPHYILSLGTLEPRKNIKSLLKAHALLPKEMKQKYPLVLVGAKGWGEVENDIQKMVDRNEIIVLGYILQDDIPLIYRAADLFVYVSLYEGYGMPVAEAMASGVAVITSQESAMSEVAQGGAALVDPLDIEQISTTMLYYLQDEVARNQLIDKSTVIAENWSWQASADKLSALFQRIK